MFNYPVFGNTDSAPTGAHLEAMFVKYALWTVQGLLALLFLGLGFMKLTSPLADLETMMGVPGMLIRFVGTVEVLGALGLILPGLLKIRAGLVPLAATGLGIVALSATGYHLTRGETGMSLFPLVILLLGTFVAYGRWQLAPHARSAHERTPARV
jgi:hypothetical protein